MLNLLLLLNNMSDMVGLLTWITVNCTPTGANSVCFPSQFQTDLYFFGDVPESFGDQLKQAILFWDFNIDELLGFGDVQVTETVVDTGDDEEDGDVADEDEDGGTPTPGPGTRDVSPVDGTVTGIDRSEGSSNRANPGAFVAAAVAFLTLVLVALFIVKRHRYHVSSDSISKHLELTDDDIDMGNETDDNTAMTPMPPPLPDVYVVGDDESYIANRSSDGHEVYRASLSNHPGFSDIVHHGPNEQCSSPNCQACEAQRQSGTRFVGANAGTESPVSNSDLKPREYEADDTVSL